jgi:capsular polysaccharide biosynthesis protein
VDILLLLKIIIRRWIVVVPVMAIVAITGYNALSSIKPKYQANADVMLIGETQSVDPVTGKVTINNPLVDIQNGLNQTGIILQTVVTDGNHHDALDKQKLSTNFDVNTDERGAPIMHVTATAGQPNIAEATVAAVVNSISAELTNTQNALKVPNDQRVGARLLTVSGAYALTGNKTRVAGAIGAVGVAAIAGAALLAESIASARARRRSRHDEAELAAVLAYPANAQVGDVARERSVAMPNEVFVARSDGGPEPAAPGGNRMDWPVNDPGSEANAIGSRAFGPQDTATEPSTARWVAGRRDRTLRREVSSSTPPPPRDI